MARATSGMKRVSRVATQPATPPSIIPTSPTGIDAPDTLGF
jgi:hypothetical protein